MARSERDWWLSFSHLITKWVSMGLCTWHYYLKDACLCCYLFKCQDKLYINVCQRKPGSIRAEWNNCSLPEARRGQWRDVLLILPKAVFHLYPINDWNRLSRPFVQDNLLIMDGRFWLTLMISYKSHISSFARDVCSLFFYLQYKKVSGFWKESKRKKGEERLI